MAKALLLLSGGLDSTLAGKLLIDMAVEVEAINFVSPFCRCTPKSLGCSAARRAAGQLGIDVHVHTNGADYLDIVRNPRHGRGKRMNPCLDCRIYSFSRAREVMVKTGADCIATGDVLGERPMSQHRRALDIIERESGLTGLVLRPLSARLLPPTKPETDGIIDRNRLLDIQGRSRKPQIALAERLGIGEYLCPGGGCLLTDRGYSARLKDVFAHDEEFDMNTANLLKHGRHFRIPGGAKVVVGRDEQDNLALERYVRNGDILLAPRGVTGPNVLLRGAVTDTGLNRAAALLASYTKGGSVLDVEIVEAPDSHRGTVIPEVAPLDRRLIDEWMICEDKKEVLPNVVYTGGLQ